VSAEALAKADWIARLRSVKYVYLLQSINHTGEVMSALLTTSAEGWLST
jgi:hypothetical protein